MLYIYKLYLLFFYKKIKNITPFSKLTIPQTLPHLTENNNQIQITKKRKNYFLEEEEVLEGFFVVFLATFFVVFLVVAFLTVFLV